MNEFDDVALAYKFSSNNMPALRKDTLCGYFYCQAIFSPSEIDEYIEDNNPCDKDGTTLCPYCGVDSVIGASSSFPITEEFLHWMYRRWFDSGRGIALTTPYGDVTLYYDDEAAKFIYRSLDPHPRYFPNVNATHRLSFTFTPDGKEHRLRIVLEGKGYVGGANPGDRFEAITFNEEGGEITIGCEASFGCEVEDGYDFYRTMLRNGIEIDITPEIKQREFIFGVCWMTEFSDEYDCETWYGADPTIVRN